MLPAHAGMIPATGAGATKAMCAPRACGDNPAGDRYVVDEAECSPRMRG